MELDPQSANAFNDRGLAFWLKGDIDHALADYNKAIEINPSFAMAYNNRGLLYGKGQGEMNLAIADFNKAIELDPKLVDAYLSTLFVKFVPNFRPRAAAPCTSI